jgi:hypothetical protein
MPRSWCYEVLLVRTDENNQLYCEANYPGTGCNWRPLDHRGRDVGPVTWYPIPMDWISVDWVALAYFDTHNDSCVPFCDRMRPKDIYLHDQDGQVS